MTVPKPPFHSATEELLYNIYLKLPQMGSLSITDINTIAKLNAIILDGDLLTSADVDSNLSALKGNVPEAGNTLAKLYALIQGLGNLKSEDIDTLQELNAILDDADLVSTANLNSALSSILDNVATEGNSFKKLYELIGTKQDMFGKAFPKTIFVSLIGNDTTALPGDFSRPYTLAGMLAIIAPGDTVSFLPGAYVINFNIARNGVTYSTFGGKVHITVDQPNATLYQYNALPSSEASITIAGDFDYVVNAEGACVFEFNNDYLKRNYCIRWDNARQYAGVFMKMPVAISTGIFEGNIEIEQEATTVAVQCRQNAPTTGAGVFNVQLYNKSLTSNAIQPWFVGFTFRISYQGPVMGLFAPPLNAGSNANEYVLNLNQGSTAETFLTSGNYSISCDGGIITITNGGQAHVKGKILNCRLNARPATASYLDVVAKNVVIENDQVDILTLDGHWEACQYNITSYSLCVMKGRFRDLKFNQSAGILKIEGYVRLKDGTWITIVGNDVVEISGKVIGKASQVFLLSYASNFVMSGYVKQLENLSPAIKSAGGGYIHRLKIKALVIEAGVSAEKSIMIDSPDGLYLTLYDKSYSNKPISEGAGVNLLIGSWTDFTIDNGLDVTDI